MAVEVDELLKEIIQNANATGPDGTSLFAGTRLNTTPFDIVMGNPAGSGEALIESVSYRGNVGTSDIEADETAYLSVDNSGNKTFWAEKQQLVGMQDLSSWQAREDSVISADGVDVAINRGDNVYAVAAKTNSSGAALKASVDPVAGGG